jgi:hypothetical protein
MAIPPDSVVGQQATKLHVDVLAIPFRRYDSPDSRNTGHQCKAILPQTTTNVCYRRSVSFIGHVTDGIIDYL